MAFNISVRVSFINEGPVSLKASLLSGIAGIKIIFVNFKKFIMFLLLIFGYVSHFYSFLFKSYDMEIELVSGFNFSSFLILLSPGASS